MPNDGLIPRDPDAEVRTRQTLDALANVVNGLIRSGDLVREPGGGGTWRLARAIRNPPNSTFIEDHPATEEMIVPGPQGLRGLQGPPGIPNFLLDDPAQGEDGIPGIAGAKGASGATGSQGPAGLPLYILEEGPPGDDGNPGQIGQVGATGPTGVQGQTGQALFVLEDGPEGEQGFRGPQGIQGATGSTGSTGSAGPIGPAVYVLEDGPPGDDGQPGASGPAGVSGSPGTTGSPGAALFLFEDAVPGEDGIPGVAGAKGITGTQGPLGPATSLLEEGPQGEDGMPIPGNRGITGTTGAQGPIGPAIPFLDDFSQEDFIPSSPSSPIPVPLNLTITDTVTNNRSTIASWTHSLSSGTAANGIGVLHDFRADTTTTVGVSMGNFYFFWSDATHATRAAGFALVLTRQGSLFNIIQAAISGTGVSQIGFLGAAASSPSASPDLGADWVAKGLATGTPTFAAANLTGYATQADQETSTSVIAPVTPGRQQFHPSAAKAWVYFTVAAGVVTVQASYNVTSITRNAAGDYTVNWTTAFSSANFAVNVTVGGGTVVAIKLANTTPLATGSVRFLTFDSTFTSTVDATFACVSAFGDQ